MSIRSIVVTSIYLNTSLASNDGDPQPFYDVGQFAVFFMTERAELTKILLFTSMRVGAYKLMM